MGSHSTRENIAGQIMKALLLLLVFSRSSHGRPQIGSTEPEQQSIVSLQSGQQQFMNRLLQQIESNTTTNFVLSGVTMQLLNLRTGQQKPTQVELVGVKVLRAELNRYRRRGGAKQSRTNSKLPSSYNAEARFKLLLYCL